MTAQTFSSNVRDENVGKLNCGEIHAVVSFVARNTAVVGISSLGYDHIRILGNSLEEIAWQKAGIIKPTSVVVTAADQPEVALKVLQSRAAEKGVSLFVFSLQPDIDM